MNEAAVPGGLRGRLGTAAMLSDDRLARRAVKGDERAFAAIFDRYHQDLYRFCLAIVGNSADAQDALQNTMVKVLRALPGEGRRIELKPWLYRIAHNESIELLRRRRPTEELDPGLATRGGSLAEDADARERLRRLIADLEQLPDRQRGALVMRELGGLDFDEIGTALGTSPGTARQTLYEARQSLRQMHEGREMNCDAITRALSDADGRITRRRDIRAHLRTCSDCRRFREEIEGRRTELGGLAPLPAVAATGLLQSLIGGAGASGGAGAGAGAGLAGAAAGGAAKSLGAGAAIKSAAAVAAVAAVGVGAADRTGVVDATPWGGGATTERRSGGDGTGEAGGGAGAGDTKAAGTRSPAAVSPASGEDASTGTNAGAGVGAGDGKAEGERGSAGDHPSGRGHQKEHPESASHGQQTAAAHKGGGKGAGQGAGGGGKDGVPKQAKPPKPSKPAKSATPPKPSSPKPSPAKPSQPVQTAPSEGAVTAPPKAPSGPGTVPQPSPSPRADEAKAAPDLPEPAHQP